MLFATVMYLTKKLFRERNISVLDYFFQRAGWYQFLVHLASFCVSVSSTTAGICIQTE